MTKALVVLSGGQDSTTCLTAAIMEHGVLNVHAITFNYGQRHARELQAARDVAMLVGIEHRGIEHRHEVLDVGPILAGTSPLTDATATLETYSDYASMDKIIGARIERTFVPMRNALFLTLAANRAAVMGAKFIYTGVCEADNANYPDCRAEFVTMQEHTINEALGFTGMHVDRIRVRTPLMYLSKAKSINLMKGMGGYALYAFTHTAYDGNYPPNGNDHASLLRAHGFHEAGLPDPLVVRAWLAGLMKLPSTHNYALHDGFNREDMDSLCDEIHRMAGKLHELQEIAPGDVGVMPRSFLEGL